MPEAAAMRRAPAVDTHAHIFLQGLPLVPGATNRPQYSCTDTDYLETLDAAGVAYGVIAAPSFLGTHNDYTLECLRRQPRLRGTAIVSPDVSRQTLEAMDRDGMVGIRYSLRRYPEVPDFTAPGYRRLLREVADLGWHVHILAESERLAVMVPVDPEKHRVECERIIERRHQGIAAVAVNVGVGASEITIIILAARVVEQAHSHGVDEIK